MNVTMAVSPALSADLLLVMTTVDADVSMAMSLLAPIEPVLPGVGSVRCASVPSTSLMVPPLRAIAVAET